MFGFSKLDVMFGRTTPEAVRLPVRDIAKPGVRFLRETITAIDPEARRVTTDAGVHEADVLVVALGADYDFDATPGLAERGNEFYSVAGAERLRRGAARVLERPRDRRRLRRAVQVPARAERGGAAAARLPVGARRARRLRDLVRDPVRDAGPAVARHLGRAARGVRRARHRVRPRPPRQLARRRRGVAVLDDGSELPFDLFLGVPKHRAPDVVLASGMTEDGYVPVDSATLETRFPGVYAVGDVATVGVPKAGVFAEGAARVVAASLIARLRGGERAGRLRRPRLLLHRVRRRPRRAGGRRLPLGPEADRHLPGAFRGARRREEALRREPPRPLVRPGLDAPHEMALGRDRALGRARERDLDRMRLGRPSGRQPAATRGREDQRPRLLAHEADPAGLVDGAVPDLEAERLEVARHALRVADEAGLREAEQLARPNGPVAPLSPIPRCAISSTMLPAGSWK